jgi:hypothetical protein
MVQAPAKPKNDINSRLAILQSGYRNFVSTIKIPIAADTKWLLEVVCLHAQPMPLDSVIENHPLILIGSYFSLNQNKTPLDRGVFMPSVD